MEDKVMEKNNIDELSSNEKEEEIDYKEKAMRYLTIAYNAITFAQLDEMYDRERLIEEIGCTEEEYDEIMEKAVAAAVGMASPARIDEINILQATYEAMREAISKLAVEPGILLNDAVTIPEMIIPQVPIIKGDAKSVSIAAASILAKVTRDRLMVEYDKVMPEYGFAGHKGYGSKEHIEAIKKYGPTPIHRKTFIKKFI